MKKIRFLLLIMIFFLAYCFPVFAQEKVEIKDARIIEQGGNVLVDDVDFNSSSVSSGIIFQELHDYVTYEIEIENDSSYDYELKSIQSNIDCDFVSVDSNSIGELIQQNDTRTIQVTFRYDQELINQEEFHLDDAVFSLLFTKPSAFVNPLTHNYVLLVIVGILVVSTLFLFLYRKGFVKYTVFLLLFMPFFTFAEDGISLQMNLDSFSVKGRFLNYNVTLYDDNHIINTYQKTYGETIEELPVLSQEGYDFNGWKDQNNHGVNNNTVVHEDLVLTSQYEPIQYQITYHLGEGTLSEDNPRYYTVEDEFTLNNPDSDKTFSGWTEGNADSKNTKLTLYKGTVGNKEFTATFSNNPEVNYIVVYRRENEDGEYEEVEREILQGASSTSVSPQPKNYDGYTTPSTQTKILSDDGTTTFTYDYELKNYSFSVTDRTYVTSNTTENGEYVSGTPIIVSAIERLGYSFIWSDGNTEYSRSFDLLSDTTFTPIYIARDDIPYKVIHKQMNLNGRGYTVKSTVTYTGVVDSSVTPKVNTYEGFTSPSETNVTIKGDGTTEVEYLYARNQYRLTINDSQYVTTDTPSGVYYYGTSITLSAKDKEGYVFDHWSNGISQNTYTFTINKDTTIQPIYDYNFYRVVLDACGGSVTPSSMEVKKGQTVNLPNPKRTGYYFDGWYTASSEGTKVSSTYQPTGNVTLYARWKKSIESLNVENTSISLQVGEEVVIEFSNSTEIEEGYSFSSLDSTIASVNDEGVVRGVHSGETDIIITGLQSHKTITIHVEVALSSYTVVFDANGGSGHMNELVISRGVETALTNNSYTRSGYRFDGWNTKVDGSGIYYADGERVTNITNASSITLYAQWVKVYSIQYNRNALDATGTMDAQIVDADTSILLTMNSFVREGYRFVGWNTDRQGQGTSFIDGANIIADKNYVLYAQWVRVYTITFDKNNSSAVGDDYSIFVASGEYIVLSDDIFALYSLTNKEIASWNTKADNSGMSYYKDQSIQVVNNITLYAQWGSSTPVSDVIYWALQDNYSKLVISDIAVSGDKSGSFAGNSVFNDYHDVPWIVGDYDCTPGHYDTSDFEWDEETLGIYDDNPEEYDNTNLSYRVEEIVVRGRVVPVSTANWFYGLGASTRHVSYDLTNLDFSHVTDTSNMFFESGFFSRTFHITGLDGADTSQVTNMHNMFESTGRYSVQSWSIGDLSNWDVSKVTDMSGFLCTTGGYEYDDVEWDVGDLSEWDVSSVTNMSCMFGWSASKSSTFDLGDLSGWDVSHVTNMRDLFSSGSAATAWYVGDLSGWDVSHVTDMSNMFSYAGGVSDTCDLGDLSGWDVSNVTNMSGLFSYAGGNSTTWTTGDLSEWDTSHVTSMSNMFSGSGSSSNVFDVHFVENWNVSNVTSMAGMFSGVQFPDDTVHFDLTAWDVSNVQYMNSMFYGFASRASELTLNLHGWDTSQVTSMDSMFRGLGYNATTWTLDIGGFNTSSVTGMGSMFARAGRNATTFQLDLTGFDTSNVTNMCWMFEYAGENSSTFIVNMGTWNMSNVVNVGYLFDSAGVYATTWTVTIPRTNGNGSYNNTSQLYGKNTSYYLRNKRFTLASS